MAERVQRHRESMSDEIREMKESKLYSDQETKVIIRRRTEYEYRVNGISKTLKDFKDYIVYEKALLEQIYRRHDERKDIEKGKRQIVENKIIKRIKNLYEIALQRFSGDLHFSHSYFKFCKQTNDTHAANVAVQNMLTKCAREEEIWRIAAQWYSRDQNNLNNALKTINKGLILHKNSKLLYTEAIELELEALNRSTDEEAERKICKELETYVQFCCEIDDATYLIEILSKLEKSKLTGESQKIIVEKLMQRYAGESYVWDALAQREKNGFHYPGDDADMAPSVELNLQRCFQKYKEGLAIVPLGEKNTLISMYLDCLLKTQGSEHRSDDFSKLQKSSIRNVLEEASKENYLNEKHFIKWLEIATSDDESLEILEKGLAANPESCELWKIQLNYAIKSGVIFKITETFKNGVNSLKAKSLPLWLTYIRYFNLLSNDDVVEETYLKGIVEVAEISTVLKSKYLEWVSLAKGITEARNVYKGLAVKQPYSKELHETMAKLESTEIKCDYGAWSNVYKLACEQFGETDTDVWIQWIVFSLHFNRKGDVHEQVQQIYNMAKQKLRDPFLQIDFEGKYADALTEG